MSQRAVKELAFDDLSRTEASPAQLTAATATEQELAKSVLWYTAGLQAKRPQ
jgi:hypothetical protein